MITNIVDIQPAITHNKFNQLCNTVEDIQEATGQLIELANRFDPKIRAGVVVKTLIACIHDGLVDEEQLRIICGWIQSQYAKYLDTK